MKSFMTSTLVVLFLVLGSSAAIAQETEAGEVAAAAPTISFAGFGFGLILVGAGLGLGLIGRAALESMARQPEIRNELATNMIILAALVEGAAVVALVLQFLK